MKKISVSDVRELADLVESFRSKFSEIADAIVELNDIRDNMRDIVAQAAEDAETYYDDRSDKWKEGETGSAYESWKDRLRKIADLLDDEIEEIDEPDWVEDVANLPATPDDM